MHRDYFGDSYDYLKRFLLGLAPEKSRRIALPMLPENQGSQEFLASYAKFLNAEVPPCAIAAVPKFERQDWVKNIQNWIQESGNSRVWLLVDTCTGLCLGTTGGSKKHFLMDDFVQLVKFSEVSVAICYDQAFRRADREKRIKEAHKKLSELRKKGVWGLYYMSHASFLIASEHKSEFQKICDYLSLFDFPEGRLVY